MHSSDIRRTFLDYFSGLGHEHVPGSSLIPSDPTLLLTNAGMNQFKPWFLGEVPPRTPRATSVQKCVRTTDIGAVGRTTRHTTFFEMLGNFSFGDYFKAEAIAWAWEFVTRRLGLARDRLWITVYEDDDEAYDLWRRVGVGDDHIQRLGKADNYWSMGVPGPSGPSSDITYDRGPAFGRDGGPAVNPERYLELWGLVFMQDVRGAASETGDYPIVGSLPRRCIDTGLGLDRVAIVLQEVDTICETDLLGPILRTVEDLCGREFPGRLGGEDAVSFQIVTEHARTIAFLIADGVRPSNEGRGHVLRRLVRRAIHHGRRLGIDDVLTPTTAAVIGHLGGVRPELERARRTIAEVVTAEEQAFARTLRHGSRLLAKELERVRTDGETVLPGDAVFRLYDTYGFPVEIAADAARAEGVAIDEDRFEELLRQQRTRSRERRRSS